MNVATGEDMFHILGPPLPNVQSTRTEKIRRPFSISLLPYIFLNERRCLCWPPFFVILQQGISAFFPARMSHGRKDGGLPLLLPIMLTCHRSRKLLLYPLWPRLRGRKRGRKRKNGENPSFPDPFMQIGRGKLEREEGGGGKGSNRKGKEDEGQGQRREQRERENRVIPRVK